VSVAPVIFRLRESLAPATVRRSRNRSKALGIEPTSNPSAQLYPWFQDIIRFFN
jgi:hypothetical protein